MHFILYRLHNPGFAKTNDTTRISCDHIFSVILSLVWHINNGRGKSVKTIRWNKADRSWFAGLFTEPVASHHR